MNKIYELHKKYLEIEERMKKITLHTGFSWYDETTKLFSLARLVNMDPSNLMDEVERLHKENHE